MLITKSSGDVLRLVASSAANLDAHVSYVDVDEATGLTFTPDFQDTTIASAGSTTTIQDSPPSGSRRNNKWLSVVNRHASTACDVTIEHYDGSTAYRLWKTTLAAGEALVRNDHGTWFAFDVNGGVKTDAAIASDTIAGRIQIATQADMESATSALLAVTPGRQHFHPSAAKFWGLFSITGTITVSYNMTSVTDTGVGVITLTINTDFSSANWACLATIEFNSTTVAQSCTTDTRAAGSIVLRSVVEAGSSADPTTWSAAGFGDQ